MPSPFDNRTVGYIKLKGPSIENAANILGASATAIAGSIANELNSRLTSGVFSVLGEPAQTAFDLYAMMASESRLRASFEATLNMTDAEIRLGGGSFKRDYPVLIDVGPGNISIRTAIKLLNDYATQNSSDPLNILSYRDSYSRLVKDLVDPNSDATEKFATLMIAKAEEFFETRASNWNSLSVDQKDALLVSYYKLGQDHFQQDYLASANAGIPYNPVIGDIGQLHITNAGTLLAALGGVTQVPIFRPEGVETVAVPVGAAHALLGHAFDGTLESAAQLLAAIGDGRMTATAAFVGATGTDRYTASFDDNPNKIVISGDISGTAVGTVSSGFLQHITSFRLDGVISDTAFGTNGILIEKKTDLADHFDWDSEIQTIIDNNPVNRIVVGDNNAVASATWNGGALAGDFGQMFGSQLGRLLGGDDPFKKLAAGTVMGAIGKEVGKAMFMSGTFSLDVVVKDAFGTLGGGAGVGSLPGAAIGAISSLLMSEFADAIDLHGFAGGLFTTVGTTLTTQLITNAYGVATGAYIGNVPVTMLTGFDSGAIFLQLEGAVAGYLGTVLAGHVAMPHYAEGATGQQIGSSIGGLVGVWFGGPVGAFIGSFVGGLAGSLIGDVFGYQPESHGRLEFLADHHFKPYGPSFWGDHGGTGVPFSKIAAYTGDVVNRLADFAGVQMNAQPVGGAQTAVGTLLSYTQVGTDFWVSEESGSIVAIAHNVSSKEDADKLSPPGRGRHHEPGAPRDGRRRRSAGARGVAELACPER